MLLAQAYHKTLANWHEKLLPLYKLGCQVLLSIQNIKIIIPYQKVDWEWH